MVGYTFGTVTEQACMFLEVSGSEFCSTVCTVSWHSRDAAMFVSLFKTSLKSCFEKKWTLFGRVLTEVYFIVSYTCLKEVLVKMHESRA